MAEALDGVGDRIDRQRFARQLVETDRAEEARRLIDTGELLSHSPTAVADRSNSRAAPQESLIMLTL
jgi:hypothetical protein